MSRKHRDRSMANRIQKIISSLLRRIAWGLLGTMAVVVLLEGGIRLGGFWLSVFHEQGNLRAITRRGDYRILCLGESTTYREYPRLLEQTLNAQNLGVHFSVIDEGKPAINTAVILEGIEGQLEKYRPNLVVAMMGINDQGIEYYREIPETRSWLFRHLRFYRLLRILWMNLSKRSGFKERADPHVGTARASEHAMRISSLTPPQPSRSVLADDPGFARFAPRRDLSPGVTSAQTLFSKGEYARAEKLLQGTLQHNARDESACRYLGEIYQRQGRLSLAKQYFEKAVEIDPGDAEAYLQLGWCYRLQQQYHPALDLLQKAMTLDPANSFAYSGSAQIYRELGQFDQAEKLYQQALATHPGADSALVIYLEMGEAYRAAGKYALAEKCFQKTLELAPANERALGALASLYAERGELHRAQPYEEKLRQHRLAPVTRQNYHRLKKILESKGIPLVCVQYPMRDVASLHKVFPDKKSVFFVDNEGTFKTAVRRTGYRGYFRDMFAGDFGHCTQKGNELLAKNIAHVIVKEVLRR